MKIVIGLLCMLYSTVLLSQLDHPKVSPVATVTQVVGFTTISIDYSRPAARGRKIFGGLVPYGRIWRVGANESTKFSIDTEVSILGNQLASGTYALYAFPEEEDWEIVFHKNTSHWGDGRKEYNPEEDAFRVRLQPQKQQSYQENFLISFDSISHNHATMVLHWANTSVCVPLSVDTDRKMEEQIAKKVKTGPTAQTLYEAARFYVEQDKKYPQVLSYVNRAISLSGDTYYFHRVKSLAEAALGDYRSAIGSAEKSLLLAQKEGKDEFVRLNQQHIDSWKEVLPKKNRK